VVGYAIHIALPKAHLQECSARIQAGRQFVQLTNHSAGVEFPPFQCASAWTEIRDTGRANHSATKQIGAKSKSGGAVGTAGRSFRTDTCRALTGAARTRLERAAIQWEPQKMNDSRPSLTIQHLQPLERRPLHTVEMHVLARAYRAAWRSLFASDPSVLTSLLRSDVLFVFHAEDVDGER
jgi:hypothetical protein